MWGLNDFHFLPIPFNGFLEYVGNFPGHYLVTSLRLVIAFTTIIKYLYDTNYKNVSI